MHGDRMSTGPLRARNCGTSVEESGGRDAANRGLTHSVG